jgi:phosphoribosylformimino-5-aminoimidazole carboxamide ribotide isomerase
MIPIIPVVDLLRGQVVRAIAGKRDTYQPWSSDGPGTVLEKLLQIAEGKPIFNLQSSIFNPVYVADLNAIQQTGSNAHLWATWPEEHDVDVMVDVGLRTVEDVRAFPQHPRLWPIGGTETLAGPDVAFAMRGPRAILSIDLQAGRLMGDWSRWPGVTCDTDVAGIARAGYDAMQPKIVILLDLAHVGETHGPTREETIAQVREVLPSDVLLAVGGGVRDRAQITRLEKLGVNAVLVSTALHLGTLP